MASSQEEPKEPKLCLPTLVLHRICTFLCEHCEPQQLQDGTNSATAANQSKMNLKNLCLVSKKLRLVAEPVLYHCWKGTFDPEWPSASLFALSSVRFLSSLHARPHLRNYVKALDIRDCARDEYSRDPDLFDLYDEDESSYPVVTGRNASILKRITASAGITCSPCDFVPENFAETIVQTMLVMLPCLNELKLVAAADKNGINALSNQLSKISKLELDLAPRRCICKDCSRNDMQIDDAWFERRAERLLIGATASHLKSLICTSGSLKEGFDMPQLDSLRVDIRHSWPVEKAFLNNLKCLRRLSFQSSCPESSRFTLKSSTTIEELSIGFGREAWEPDAFDRFQFEGPINFTMPDLKHFTNLKWLSIHIEAICSIQTPEPKGEFETFLLSLPDKLEILHIVMNCNIDVETGYPLDIVRFLLAFPSARNFTNLKAILWSFGEERNPNAQFFVAKLKTNPDGQPQLSTAKQVTKMKLNQPENKFFPDWERLLAK